MTKLRKILLKKNSLVETLDESIYKENQALEIKENEEICINYVVTRERWNQNEIIIDDIFAYHVAQNVINENEYLQLISMDGV